MLLITCPYTTSFSINTFIETRCPNGKLDAKSSCDCSKAPGWIAGEWRDPWCFDKKCYTGQKYNECDGMPDKHPLGDGTWCWKNSRNTKCPAVEGEIKHL